MRSAAEIVHEVETAYGAYAGAFNQQDIDRVVKYIAVPYVMIIGAHPPMIAATEADRDKQFHGALAGMKARGWVRSDFRIVHIWPFSEDHAMILTDIVRYRGDGSVLEKGRYAYMFRRAEPNWQITQVTDVAEPFLGPGEFPRA